MTAKAAGCSAFDCVGTEEQGGQVDLSRGGPGRTANLALLHGVRQVGSLHQQRLVGTPLTSCHLILSFFLSFTEANKALTSQLLRHRLPILFNLFYIYSFTRVLFIYLFVTCVFYLQGASTRMFRFELFERPLACRLRNANLTLG